MLYNIKRWTTIKKVGGVLMKKICKVMGTALLSVAALIAVIGPASISGVGIEEIPESIKNKR
jgi:hypothetical protein